jgi:hypothetical protein
MKLDSQSPNYSSFSRYWPPYNGTFRPSPWQDTDGNSTDIAWPHSQFWTPCLSPQCLLNICPPARSFSDQNNWNLWRLSLNCKEGGSRFPAESCQCHHCEICCVWAQIIMQYSDLLPQFSWPLFANNLAYGIMKKAALIMHINCCTVWQSCDKRWEHKEPFVIPLLTSSGKKLKSRSTLNHPHKSLICSKIYGV